MVPISVNDLGDLINHIQNNDDLLIYDNFLLLRVIRGNEDKTVLAYFQTPQGYTMPESLEQSLKAKFPDLVMLDIGKEARRKQFDHATGEFNTRDYDTDDATQALMAPTVTEMAKNLIGQKIEQPSTAKAPGLFGLFGLFGGTAHESTPSPTRQEVGPKKPGQPT